MPSVIRLKTQEADDLGTVPAGKVDIFVDDDTLEPSYKIPAGTVLSLKGTDGDPGELDYLDHGNTGATETVDVQAESIQRLVANAATVTLTLSNPPASGTPAVVALWLEQDGTGGRDWAFPGSVDFGDPGEPIWTTRAAGAVDIVTLWTVDGGTTYIATVQGREGPPVSEILDIPTAEMDDTLVLAPDGAGGVEFRAESGGGGGVGAAIEYLLGADVALNNSLVWFDGPSGTPAAGTYTAIGRGTFTGTANANNMLLRLLKGATEIDLAEWDTTPTSTNDHPFMVFAGPIVLDGSTVVKLQAASFRTDATLRKDVVGITDNSHMATKLMLTRIA